MDCRRLPRWGRWAFPLTPCLILGLGCYPQASLPVASSTSTPPPGKEVVAEKDLPKRKPKASTCVAFGDLEYKGALDATRTPLQKEQALEMARQYYQQGIRTDPKCLEAYMGLARTYEASGNHNAAVTTYLKALEVSPKQAALWYELGMCQARNKEWTPALERLQKATELDPDNRIYSHMLAYTLARAGRYEESIACFRKTVGEARARYNVARMMHHLHQEDACKQQLQLALTADPGLEPAQQLLAQLTGPAASIKTAEAIEPEKEDALIPASATEAPSKN